MPKSGKNVCQVYGCTEDLGSAELFFSRQRICKEHARAESVPDGYGGLLRFCQQCTKLQALACFDGIRRSCRASLAKRHERLSRAGATSDTGGSSPARGKDVTSASSASQGRRQSGSSRSRPSRKAAGVNLDSSAAGTRAQLENGGLQPAVSAVLAPSPPAVPATVDISTGGGARLASHPASPDTEGSLPSSLPGITAPNSVVDEPGASWPAPSSCNVAGPAANAHSLDLLSSLGALLAAPASLASNKAAAGAATPPAPILPLPDNGQELQQLLAALQHLQMLVGTVAIPQVQQQLAITEASELLRKQLLPLLVGNSMPGAPLQQHQQHQQHQQQLQQDQLPTAQHTLLNLAQLAPESAAAATEGHRSFSSRSAGLPADAPRLLSSRYR